MCEEHLDGICRTCDLHIAEIESLRGRLAEAEAAKNGAYSERDRLVCALSKLIPAWLERHPDTDTEWEDDWRWIVHVEGPSGQMTWHIHDSEVEWFDHLERRAGSSWDGHSTEQKYERLAAMAQDEGVGGE